ncbi:MAG: hypothetical protein OEV43_01465, partial [Coriobacteriia bacterium]|nr:hypothetical protein [Coriobacteriia bacterium]
MSSGQDPWVRAAISRIAGRRASGLLVRHLLLCAVVVVACVPALGTAGSAGPEASEGHSAAATGGGPVLGLPGGESGYASPLQSPEAAMAQAPAGIANLPATSAGPSGGHADGSESGKSAKPPRAPKPPKDKKPKKGEDPPPPPPP